MTWNYIDSAKCLEPMWQMKKSIEGLQIMGWIFSAPQAGKSKADTVSLMIFLIS